ncbi:MAG: class I SAM-dependent methyltransferase [Planctomycetota bacterium]|jgi:cyclopropane fatty-acyl-phospholipid synthase-like methyltransferase
MTEYTTTAEAADKHKLYEKAVQCVKADVDFIIKIFNKTFERDPHILKEDFCGTFSAAVEFVNRNKNNKAIAVDLDRSVLGWGIENNLPNAGGRMDHISIINKDVIEVSEPKVDVVMSMNFSYFIFKEREKMKTYFSNVYNSLKDEGLYVLDIYGGYEAQCTQEEKTDHGEFTYVWDQNDYNPITNEVLNHIHFEFPDGTRIEKAFTYDWRLWTPQELIEILKETGFSSADVFWEGWDEEAEEGTGDFQKTKKAENMAGWIAYITAVKKEV